MGFMFLRHAAIALLAVTLITTMVNAQGAVPTPPSNSFNWLNLNRQGGSAAQNCTTVLCDRTTCFRTD